MLPPKSIFHFPPFFSIHSLVHLFPIPFPSSPFLYLCLVNPYFPFWQGRNSSTGSIPISNPQSILHKQGGKCVDHQIHPGKLFPLLPRGGALFLPGRYGNSHEAKGL